MRLSALSQACSPVRVENILVSERHHESAPQSAFISTHLHYMGSFSKLENIIPGADRLI